MKVYTVNMTKVIQWVTETPQTEKNVFTTITQRWESMDEGASLGGVTSKDVTESKSNINETTSGYRLELVKFILSFAFSAETDRVIMSDRDLTYAQRMAIESLIKEGLVEVVDKDYYQGNKKKQYYGGQG
ncbi:MAG: hypothetical protein LUD72_00080 [Bacteroidales bacterium]|nr:hypothetical protein [Bacteroidales bacterium]